MVVFISITEHVVLDREKLDTYADLYGAFRFLWTLLTLHKGITHCCISPFYLFSCPEGLKVVQLPSKIVPVSVQNEPYLTKVSNFSSNINIS